MMFIANSRHKSLLLVVSVVSGLAYPAFSKARFTVQAGAFSANETARSLAASIETAGVTPTEIRSESTSKGPLFKVLAGSFETRAEAEEAKSLLKQNGISGYVRSLNTLSPEMAESAILGSDRDYFSTGGLAVIDPATTFPLSSDLEEKRKEALSGETTSPETLKALQDYISLVPADNPSKARDIILLAYRTFSGKSAYDEQAHDYSSVKALLLPIANGEIAAYPKDKATARDMVTHLMHYYSRDYPAALKAYRQILADQISSGDAVGASKTRLEIAAASYELAKETGFDKGRLQQKINELWQAQTQLEAQYLGDGSRSDGRTIQINTLRLGLMLTEIMNLQKDWSDARSVAEGLIDAYRDLPGCQGYIAESYCHLAHIGVATDDRILAYDSADKAIDIARRSGKVWGDARRDVLWKAYLWKLTAYEKFGEPQVVIDLLKKDISTKFPNHQDLDKWIGGAK